MLISPGWPKTPPKIKNSKAKWKIAFGHQPWISIGDHGNAPPKLDKFFRKLFDSGLIDIYLSGSQTSGLPIGDFVYDIEKYPSGASNVEGAVDKILAGSFLVYPQVTT